MKYAIIIPDGCADNPDDFPNQMTPLRAANIPNMDALARHGIVGQSQNVPPELPPGSDVATLSLLGYNPREAYTGRAPLEAVAQGIPLGEHDWAVRCNLVTITDNIMRSFTAGHIASEEAAALLNSTGREIANAVCREKNDAADKIEFFPGVSYRNLMLYRSVANDSPFDATTQTLPPHDYSDQDVTPATPRGKGSDLLLTLMKASERLFAEHPVNRKRIEAGKLPATQCWLWGLGKRPNLIPFAERFFGVRGAMISAVDLLAGIAALLQWDRVQTPGITGYIDTDYNAKGKYAAAALDKYDLICVHVEAPDEASHEGSFEKKTQALQDIDAKVVPPIVEKLKSFDDWRLLISPDHPTQISTKTHSHGAVPWIVAGSDIPARHSGDYNELTAAQSPYRFPRGWELMNWFIAGK
ncbi:MAG: cofactor-independent phosphoglycerate mutase [Planctomycetaceae bacterium]|jgi:2,3-bisphosphoglycerate-independent phosphoglycerate mutase|nr:cofactor-independent phosphoglycerate mutase [Planctomycetaceae bacterium]